MKIAILGYGTVGSAVAKALIENEKIIKARCGQSIIPVIALARKKKTNPIVPIVYNIDEILKRDDIDVFVELMGGIEEPFKIISKLLKQGKNVVSANKALLAYHRYELEALAKNSIFGYEASVAGGIPIVKILKEGLSANHIEGIQGILNGTCNYILTQMKQHDTDFAQALKQAQDLGYAEADPSFDISGQDSAHKLLILASLAYGLKNKPEDILIEGIEQISNQDLYFAKEFDYVIKLLGLAKARGKQVELRVHPVLIHKEKLLARVNGVMNAINIKGDMLTDSLYYGAGAGGSATASAVISDLMDIARLKTSKAPKSPMLGFSKGLKYSLIVKDKIYTKYYLRLKVEDKLGVLSKITQLMRENGISIDSFLQKPKLNTQYSTIFFTTHYSYEKKIQTLLKKLEKQNFVKEKIFMMRIEE